MRKNYWKSSLCPLDQKALLCKKKGGTKILIGWNRGLGDIPLGLYAIVKRLYMILPDATITFLTRENLAEGFSLLQGVHCITDPTLKRGEKIEVKKRLMRLGISPNSFDLIFETVSPTDWVAWQRGWITPRLCWKEEDEKDNVLEGLPEGFHYIGVQVEAETGYGLWRNWPAERWEELFARLGCFPNVRVLLFGFGKEPLFSFPHVIDLRGKTSLYELLTIVKKRCRQLILPDSGILSMVYYLDVDFPIEIFSLWGDVRHGVLKQNVPSPNRLLRHVPLFKEHRNLSALSAVEVIDRLFPAKPVRLVTDAFKESEGRENGAGVILLAGGQGSRLGWEKSKGLFPVLGKTLFQWLIEQVPETVPVAVMTSARNHAEITTFFQERKNFGREVSFFQQREAPFLDFEGNQLDVLAPRGNGDVFYSFKESGLLNEFQRKGIDTVIISSIDNPLADPLDRRLLGHHRRTGAEATVKCIRLENQERPMGALVERQGRIEILEYFSLPEGDYPYRYVGTIAFSLPLMERASQFSLPVYRVKKKIPFDGKVAWKQETLLFDALPFAKRVSALCFDPKVCYAPLKTASDLPILESCLSGRK